MLWNVYLRNGTAFIPTVAETDAGFFLNGDPVEVVSARDTEALQYAIKQAIGRGNPKVPTPTRATFPKPVVLKYAKAKSWSVFEKGCSTWTIVEKDRSSGSDQCHYGAETRVPKPSFMALLQDS